MFHQLTAVKKKHVLHIQRDASCRVCVCKRECLHTHSHKYTNPDTPRRTQARFQKDMLGKKPCAMLCGSWNGQRRTASKNKPGECLHSCSPLSCADYPPQMPSHRGPARLRRLQPPHTALSPGKAPSFVTSNRTQRTALSAGKAG